MEDLYRKKIPLTDEEIKHHSNMMLNSGLKEEQYEAELNKLTENYNAEKKMKQNDIQAAKDERIEQQRILQIGYRYEDVPYLAFSDSELNKHFLIRTDEFEILDIIESPEKTNGIIEFFSVVKIENEADAESFLDTIGFLDPEKQPVLLSTEILEGGQAREITLYAFRYDDHIQILRFKKPMNYKKFESLVVSVG